MTKLFYLIAFIAAFTIAQANDYCTPPRYKSGPYTGIAKVTLEGIDHTSSYYDGYANFTSTGGTASLESGSTYTIMLDLYYDPSMLSYFAGNLAVRVWIDWNQDYDFLDTGEEVLAKLVSCAGSTENNPITKFSASITVPANAKPGKTRMRVYEDMPESDGHDKPNPCGYLKSSNSLGQHGECEDYTVQLGPVVSQPAISLSTDLLEFGQLKKNESVTNDIEISNEGQATLTITKIEFKDNEKYGYSISNVAMPLKIEPGKSFVLPVIFNPKDTGDFISELVISSNDPENPKSSISLWGSAYSTNPVMSLSLTAFDFGKASKSTIRDITVKNLGNDDLVISDAAITGPEAQAFRIVNPDFTKTIAPDGQVVIKIEFLPDEDRLYNASLNFKSNDPQKSDISISMKGQGEGFTSVTETSPAESGIHFLENSIIRIDESPEFANSHISLFSIDGNKVFESGFIPMVDVSRLTTGAYVLVIGDKSIKFIK